MKYFVFILLSLSVLTACNQAKELPDYGKITIPGQYENQLAQLVDSTDLEGKVLVVDFVFTHCPNICIPMAGQMKRVQEKYGDKKDLKLMSFSIDPKRDTLERLQWYADKVGVNNDVWWLLRTDMEMIKTTAKEFKVFQEADADAPGGFNHQSWFLLIDKNGHMRGSYDGTEAEDVDQLMKDMKQLL